MAKTIIGLTILFCYTCLMLMLISLWTTPVECRHVRHGGGNHSNSTHSEVLLARELSSRMAELNSHWNCSDPKPRLVYIHEENPEHITSNNRWIPPVAVLHRCEHHTGCCLNHPADKCQPIQTELASILFKHIDVLKNAQTYERLTFTNHTQCGCVSEFEVPTVSSTTTTSTSTTVPTVSSTSSVSTTTTAEAGSSSTPSVTEETLETASIQVIEIQAT